MRNESINKNIYNLWKKNFHNDINVYAPLFYDNFVWGSILFVGFNPSFNEDGFIRILKDTEFENVIHAPSFYKWSNISKDLNNIETCISIDRYAIEKYVSFFRPLKKIADEVCLPFEHADLFLYRETNQHELRKRIFKNGELNEFGIDQIGIFYSILNLAQPKIIVVANALASEIIKNQFESLITNLDQEKGYANFILKNKMKVPIFFSSMITGQRALDRWSLERLKWHIGKAAKSFKNN